MYIGYATMKYENGFNNGDISCCIEIFFIWLNCSVALDNDM